MSIFNRLGKLPARNVHKWIHTSTYLRAAETPAKPHIDPAISATKTTNLLNSTKLGRHRSTKLKRTMAMATLPGKQLYQLYEST